MGRTGFPLVLAIGIGAFAAGFASGFLLRRDPVGAGRPSRLEDRRAGFASTPADAPAALPASEGAGDALQKRVEVQRERIRELEERLVEAGRKAGGVRTKAEKLAIAKEIYESFLRLSKGTGDSEETLKAMGRIGELDADMASFFIDRYKEQRGKPETEYETALFLALASGGPEVSALILGHLTDPSVPAAERQSLLQGISENGGFYSMNRIPVNEELCQVALRLGGSQDQAERQGGAGLLGGVDTVQSRAALQQMAFNDADWGVRSRALRSLGYVGDRGTLQVLESYSLPAVPAPTPENPAQNWQHRILAQTLEAAKERLKKRFPP